MTALADLSWPVRTERLAIRPMTPDDADAVWAYRRLPEVNEWTGSVSTDRASFEQRLLTPKGMAQTLVVLRDDRVVGDLMARIEDVWAQAEVADRAAGKQAELGWTFDPAAGGQGLATEAVRALLALCFDDLGLHRVVGLCFAANERSWRLMERVGMRRETHAVQDSLHADRGWLDGYGYAVLAHEWRARARV